MSAAVESEIKDDDDLAMNIEEVIGKLEDLKEALQNQDYQQALAEIADVQSDVNVFHRYISEKAQ